MTRVFGTLGVKMINASARKRMPPDLRM
jgi:hypothetical protein